MIYGLARQARFCRKIAGLLLLILLCLCVCKIASNIDTSKQQPYLTYEESSIVKTMKPRIAGSQKNSKHSGRYDAYLLRLLFFLIFV